MKKAFLKWTCSICIILLCASCSGSDGEETDPAPENRVEGIIRNFYDPHSNVVLVAAHRGHWRNYPENSLPAIQSAIEIGTDIVELDVRLTRDGHLILMHDKSLDRTTTGSGDVDLYSLSQLKTLRLLSVSGDPTDYTIPTLEEALLLAKGKILIQLDKSEYLIREIMEVLERTGTKNQALFIGFAPYEDVSQAYGQNLDSIHYIPAVHKSTESPTDYIREFQEKLAPKAFAFWFDSDNSPVLDLFPHVAGQNRIWVNTTDSNQSGAHTDNVSLSDPEAGWGWVIAKGANIILTDNPAFLLQYLRNTDRHE